MDKKLLAEKARQFIKLEMVSQDINFIQLHNKMVEKGYDYTLDAIRQKVGRGTYDARFLFAFADSLGLEVKLLPIEN